jgi:FMN phosphatase YigB (HAD superfamily)
MNHSPVTGVLFDLDDTLVDWSDFPGDWLALERIHIERMFEFLIDAGRPLHCTVDLFVNTYRERVSQAWVDARTTLRAPHMTRLLMETLERFGFVEGNGISLKDCVMAYGWGELPGVVPFPDVHEGLAAILERGIRIGIVTNAFQPMWMRDAELKLHQLIEFFPEEKCRISAADFGYLKPHPTIFEHAVSMLGTRPEETIYVGDNPVADIAGSQGAGLRAVLRVNRSLPPLISGLIVPDATIKSLLELVTLLDEWNGR